MKIFEKMFRISDVFRIILPIVLVISMLLTSACSAGGSGSVDSSDGNADVSYAEESSAPEIPPFSLTHDGVTDYVIIRSDEADEKVLSAAATLQKVLTNRLKTQFSVKSDFVNGTPAFSESPYEIIVGECDRDDAREVRSSLKKDDYVILVRGTRLIIMGGSPSATASAVTYFTTNLVPECEGLCQGDLYRKTAKYPVEAITLNGVDISQYRLVYKSTEKTLATEAAAAINDRIAKLIGIYLPVVPSGKEQGEHEIYIGNCGTGISSGLSVSGTLGYAVASDGNNVAISAGGNLVTYMAAKTFSDRYFPENSEGKLDVSIPAGTEYATLGASHPLADGASIRIMSNNILADATLADRIPLLLETYLEYLPDVLCLQECNGVGHAQLVKRLGEIYINAVGNIGGTSETCYTPILFRKDLYSLAETGSLLYDQRWPLTNTKTLAWAVLREKATGKNFIIMNTHCAIITSSYDTVSVFGKVLDNNVEGAAWRADNARQIIETLEKLQSKYGKDVPVFLMGDMNAQVSSEAITKLKGAFSLCSEVATLSDMRNAGSWHSVGSPSTASGPIDHMFTVGKAVIRTHALIKDARARNSSDHFQLYCDISF